MQLCDVASLGPGTFGMCQTKDEANILRNYLLLSGGYHSPMLIPQPSILLGQKRPDFLCYVPISRFQYQPLVILVDRPGKSLDALRSEDELYHHHRFGVRRILIDWKAGFSYFKAARDLRNWIDSQ
jgi:hypothetical protein